MSVTQIERVVVYDENPFFRKLIIEILHAFEIPMVHGCSELSTVTNLLKNKTVDCLVMDWATEQDADLNLVKEIRKGMAGVNLETPIVLCTANTLKDQLFAARDAGVDEIVAKPISHVHLLDKILYARFKRREFVETSEYRGPSRRRRDVAIEFMNRRGDAKDDIELFE